MQKHGAMAAGKDEAVPVLPFGVGRIVIHVIGPELICHGSASQGQARMAGIGLLDRISG